MADWMTTEMRRSVLATSPGNGSAATIEQVISTLAERPFATEGSRDLGGCRCRGAPPLVLAGRELHLRTETGFGDRPQEPESPAATRETSFGR